MAIDMEGLIKDVMREATTRVGRPDAAGVKLMGDALTAAGGMYGDQTRAGINESSINQKLNEQNAEVLRKLKPLTPEAQKVMNLQSGSGVPSAPSLGVGDLSTQVTPYSTGEIPSKKKVKNSLGQIVPSNSPSLRSYEEGKIS
jgi:hypothetical protein